MKRDPCSSIAETRLSRRSAARLLGGVGATAVLAATRLAPLPGAAKGAPEIARSSSFTNPKENIAMTANNQTPETAAPTVVLLHGAFADASGWYGVIELLEAAGVAVTAPPNPLRSLVHDAAYIASYLDQIPGPVLLVGHSYGGAVITNAGSQASNVVGLVYVAAFVPDEGETLLELASNSKDSVVLSALIPLQFPTGNGMETATEFVIDPARVQEVFGADLPQSQTALLAASQRPLAEVTFAEPTTAPAWKSLPSWAVVPTGDKTVGTDAARFGAERAGATITEIDASHVVMISQPQAVADVIMTALEAVKSGSATPATVAAA
jgi:pimeloyl-ACP methyl ester carboxylesterase